MMKKIFMIVAVVMAGIGALGFFLVSAILFPDYTEPKVTGLHEVANSLYTWTDERRLETYTDSGKNRSVTVKLFYPADAVPDETVSYPLVVFSHGAFGMIDSNYSTCMELASNGYVVASVAHPYHAIFVEDSDGKKIFADRNFMQQTMHGIEDMSDACAAYGEWMEIRTGDLNFVLEQILARAKAGEVPFALADPEHIGLFGHSMGGAASVALGRQRDDIDAVIDLEGSMLAEIVGFDEEKELLFYEEEPYPVPVLDVNSRTVYDKCMKDSKESNSEYVNFYVLERAVDGREVIFNGAGHLNFTDLPMVSPLLAKILGVGDVDPLACIENVNAMVLAYFNHYLKDVSELELPEEY